jgi:hypothetical protein
MGSPHCHRKTLDCTPFLLREQNQFINSTMTFKLLKSTLLSLILLLCELTIVAQTGEHAQPRLSRSTKGPVTSGASIELKIVYSKDGFDPGSRPTFFFLQGKNRVQAAAPGGTGILETATQLFNVTVPDGLIAGICQVIAQLGDFETQPITLEVTVSVPAPIVTSQYVQVTSVPQYPPRAAQAGDIASVEGTNFGPSDEVEIVDARGSVFRVPTSSSSASASSGFKVPDDVADGEASFEIVEQRSGAQLRSNKVKFQILNVPLPTEILPDGVRPVAPGQWLDIGVEDNPPYGEPKQIDIAFVQSGETTIIPTQLAPNDELHVQVPPFMLPGDTTVKTRTHRNGRTSDWSQPARITLLTAPAAPLVESVQPIRPKQPGAEPFVHLRDKQEIVSVESGDRVGLSGHFGIESTASLRLTLVKGWTTLTLMPRATDQPHADFCEVELPRNLKAGDWQVYVSEVINSTSARLNLIIRVTR